MPRNNKKRGYTLLEMIIVISLGLIIGLAISSFGRNIFTQNYAVSKSLIIEGDTKMAMTKMVSELRRTQPASNGSYPIELASSTTIIFYSDVNNDGLRERVRYWLDGKILRRGIIKPFGQYSDYTTNNESINVLVNDFSTTSVSIFSYYNDSYDGTASSSPLAQPVDVRSVNLVKIDLITLTSQVMLRNLKDNF